MMVELSATVTLVDLDGARRTIKGRITDLSPPGAYVAIAAPDLGSVQPFSRVEIVFAEGTEQRCLSGMVVQVVARDLAALPAGIALQLDAAAKVTSRPLPAARPAAASPPVAAGPPRAMGPLPANPRVAAPPPRRQRKPVKDPAPELEAELSRLRGKSPHEVLGVAETATAADAERAYCALMHRFHPDRYERLDDPRVRELSSELATLLNRAHAVMSDPSRPVVQPAASKPAAPAPMPKVTTPRPAPSSSPAPTPPQPAPPSPRSESSPPAASPEPAAASASAAKPDGAGRASTRPPRAVSDLDRVRYGWRPSGGPSARAPATADPARPSASAPARPAGRASPPPPAPEDTAAKPAWYAPPTASARPAMAPPATTSPPAAAEAAPKLNKREEMATYHLGAARALRAAGDLKGAIKTYELVLRSEPENTAALVEMERCIKALIAEEGQDRKRGGLRGLLGKVFGNE